MRCTKYCLILVFGFLLHGLAAGQCDTKTTCNECMEVRNRQGQFQIQIVSCIQFNFQSETEIIESIPLFASVQLHSVPLVES